MSMNLFTPVGLLAFPHLFTPRPRAEGKTPDFNATLIFDVDAQMTPEFRAMQTAVNELAHEKAAKYVQSLTYPWRAGAEKAEIYPGVFGSDDIYVSPWSSYRPGIVDRDGNVIEDPQAVWGGQTARMQIHPFFWEVSGKRGISFGLDNVQVVDIDGPRLDGRIGAQQAFAQAPPLLGYAGAPRILGPATPRLQTTRPAPPPRPQQMPETHTTPPQGSGRVMAPKRPTAQSATADRVNKPFDDDIPF
jgi:hypothetical protein